MILIDNYDSFTYNIVQAFQMLGENVDVIRSVSLSSAPDRLVIGPGPGAPHEIGITKKMLSRLSCPVLGICLGHQAIGEVFGAKVVRASRVMHGKNSLVYHTGEGIFQKIPNPFQVTRYHSLIVEDLPEELKLTAWTEEGEIMALCHQTRPIFGVQFHPESIATQYGNLLFSNFCSL